MFAPRPLSLAARRVKPSAAFTCKPTSAALPCVRFFAATAIQGDRITQTIKADHRGLERARDEILKATDIDERTKWANQFVWELARHSIAEELVVYPAMERHVPGGKEMAEKDREQHQVVKEKLYKFQKLHPLDDDFEPTLKSIWDDLGQHIKEEEEHDLLALDDKLDADTSESMSRSFDRTKMFLPTRSHPSAPARPPFETVAGLMAAPMDHLMDIFRKFPEEKKGQMPP